MRQNFIQELKTLPAIGLFTIDNPSTLHPKYQLWCEMEQERLIVTTQIEEGGIIAVGLTFFGRSMKKKYSVPI